jgi:hypothetical protein
MANNRIKFQTANYWNVLYINVVQNIVNVQLHKTTIFTGYELQGYVLCFDSWYNGKGNCKTPVCETESIKVLESSYK